MSHVTISPNRTSHTGQPGVQTPLKMRPPSLRINDFYEVYESPSPESAEREAERCMNCGAAFCMPTGGYKANTGQPAGCPIHNRIPDWNALTADGRWQEAYDRLALTNNFPEFTARVCPAPCQDACIVGIHDRPVAIKGIERAIIDTAFNHGWVKPRTPENRTGKTVAIIGSGPAGLAAADELNTSGHTVTVFERSDQPGGLLRYGIPSMKLDKRILDRRIDLMQQSGVRFICNAHIGKDIDPTRLREKYDALILATGALQPRDLDLPGRELTGIVQAMPYLTHAARRQPDRAFPTYDPMSATGKNVVVIGGGDTGADCIATALRQNARSVTNITRREQPPDHRDESHTWPGPTGAYVLDYAHEEGLAAQGADPRQFAVNPVRFIPDAYGTRLTGLLVEKLNAPSNPQSLLTADMVILAIGFTGTDAEPCFHRLGIPASKGSTQLHHTDDGAKVWVTGDARQGPSLVVHAIADGRKTAADVHEHINQTPTSINRGR